VAAGIISADLELVQSWAARGMRFISYATEEILLQQAATRAVQQLATQHGGPDR
jgi:2-keto-3-deoxy-L-rhamnonate aldolase RhmA